MPGKRIHLIFTCQRQNIISLRIWPLQDHSTTIENILRATCIFGSNYFMLWQALGASSKSVYLVCLRECLKDGKKSFSSLAQFVRLEWWGQWCVISRWSGNWCVWLPVWSDISQLKGGEVRCISPAWHLDTADYFLSQPQFPQMLPKYKHLI